MAALNIRPWRREREYAATDPRAAGSDVNKKSDILL